MGIDGKYSDEMQRLAAIGAEARLAEIESERERLLEMFPELRKKTYKPRATPAAKAFEPVVLFDAAKVKPKRVVRTFTPEFKAAAVARVKAGEYSVDVARDNDVETKLVVKWCEAAGVKPRPLPEAERERRKQAARIKGGQAKAGKQHGSVGRANGKRSTEEREQIADQLIRLIEAGASINGAARQLGMPPQTAQKYVAARRKAEKKEKRNGHSNGVHVTMAGA